MFGTCTIKNCYCNYSKSSSFFSIEPSTVYKGCGKDIHKRTTVQTYHININNIKTKTCKQYRIELNPSYYYIQNTLLVYKMNYNTKIILKQCIIASTLKANY
jgi:hypothetical protein